MPAIVTNKFRIHNSEQFLEAFSEASGTNQYIFIGKVSPWEEHQAGGACVNIDSAPPSPNGHRREYGVCALGRYDPGQAMHQW